MDAPVIATVYIGDQEIAWWQDDEGGTFHQKLTGNQMADLDDLRLAHEVAEQELLRSFVGIKS